MKYIIIVILTALFLPLAGNGEGVDFNTHISLAEALKQVRKTNKKVFIDFYTSWCGPCKAMVQYVFSDKVVGDFFNANFVSIKVDAENGEGPELVKRYPVAGFPTYLIIDNEGEEMHRMVGFYDIQELIPAVKKGMQTKTSLTYLRRQYDARNQKPAVIADLAEAMHGALLRKELSLILDSCLANLSESKKFDARYNHLYKYCGSLKDKRFEYFLEHADLMVKGMGREKFEEVINQVSVPLLMRQQVYFKEKGFLEKRFAPLLKLKLSGDCETQVLLGIIPLFAEGDTNKILEYCRHNLMKLSDKNRVLVLDQLLAVPLKGTLEQKKALHSLLSEVRANSPSAATKHSVALFLKRLEDNME